MRKIFFILIFFTNFYSLFAQPADCSTNNATTNFFTRCRPGTSFTLLNDNYSVDVGNNHTLVLNGDIEITGELFFKLVGSFSRVTIPVGVTVKVTSLTFSGSATGKNLIVDGTLEVEETLDFGGMDIEIDGSGSISANEIIGAENIGCGADNNCPTIIAGDCNDGTDPEDPGFCNDDLPIVLISFTAKLENNSTLLIWKTVKEEDFSHFEIERSIDGGKSFVKIGAVEGVGQSVTLRTYSYVDQNAPFGKLFYRLNAVDLDGSFEYSPIVSVTKGLEGLLTAFPNPTESKRIYIRVPDAFGDTFQRLEFFSLTGERMMQLNDVRVQSEIALPSNIPSGIYIMNVVHNGLVENIKVLVR